MRRLYQTTPAAVAVATLLVTTPALAQRSDAAVELAIANTEADEAIRCTVMLAHFFTVELGAAAPGASLRLAMGREAGTGALTITGPTGEAMAIESIVCGLDDDWTATWDAVPLRGLRVFGGGTLRVDCAMAGRLRCTAR